MSDIPAPEPASTSPPSGEPAATSADDPRSRAPQAAQPAAAPVITPQLLAQAMAANGMRPGIAGFMAAQLTVQAQAQWQGQFPPPQAVEHYEKVLPGTFDRMIKMAEELQVAQIAETKAVQQYAHSDQARGHWLGFAVAVSAIVAALIAVIWDHPVVASVFISLPVMGVAKALIDSAKQPSPSDLLAAAAKQPASETPAVAPANGPSQQDAAGA
jgi:uncharacterized membrane protein